FFSYLFFFRFITTAPTYIFILSLHDALPICKAFIYIITGAALWGTIGFYVENLYAYGFTPMEVVTLRVSTAAMMLLIYMSFYAPKQLKLKKWTDISYFIGTGVFSII